MAASKEMELAIKIAGKIDSSFNSAMSAVGKGIKGATKIAAGAALAAGAAVGALGVKAIEIGKEYESAMSKVQATMLLDTSTEEGAAAMATLEEAARQCGRETAFSATQAAEGLNYLALAGYSAEEAAAALPVVLKLAGAGAMELSNASDMVTDAMGALNLEPTQENLESFADQMAKTASISNTSVSQLGEAILTVGGTAANLKGGTAELMAMAGTLANVGIKGAEGGTHIRNMIQSLQSARNSDAAALFEEIGLSAYDAEGNMRSMGEIFGDLNEYMEGMSQEEVDSVISTIFKQTDLASARAMLAATSNSVETLEGVVNSSMASSGKTLADMGVNLSELAENFDSTTTQEQFAAEMLSQYGMDAETAGMVFSGLSSIVNGTGVQFGMLENAINDSAGACQDMYDIQLDNLKGDIEILKSGLADLGISVYKELAPALREGTQMATEMVGRISAAYDEGGLQGMVSAVGTVMGDLIGTIADYAPLAVDTAVLLVESLIAGISDNAPRIATGAAQAGVAFIQGLFRLVPLVILTGIDLIIYLAQAITAMLPTLMANGTAAVQNFAIGIVQRIPAIISTGLALLHALVTGLIQNAPTLIASGILLIGTLLSGLLQAWPQVINEGIRLVLGLAQGIIQNAPLILQTGVTLVGQWLSGVLQNIPNIIAGGLLLVGMLVQAIWEGITGTDWIAVGGQIISGIADGFMAGFGALIDTVKGLWEDFSNWLSGLGSAEDDDSWLADIGKTREEAAQTTQNINTGADSGERYEAWRNSSNQAEAQAAGENAAAAYAQGLQSGQSNAQAAAEALATGTAEPILAGVSTIMESAPVAEAGEQTAVNLWDSFQQSLGTATNGAPAIDFTNLNLGFDGLNSSMEQAGTQGAQSLTTGLDGGFGVYQFNPAGLGIDGSVMVPMMSNAGMQGGAAFTGGLDGVLQNYSFDATGVGIDIDGLMASLGAAGETGGETFTSVLDTSLSGYNFDPSSIGVDASGLTASMTQAGTESGQALTQALQAAMASGDLDPATVIGFDASSLTAQLTEAGTGGGTAFTTALTGSLDAFAFDPATVGIDAGVMTSHLAPAGTAGGQALTSSLQGAITAGSGAVVGAVTSMVSRMTTAMSSGWARMRSSAVSAMNSLVSICSAGASRAAGAIRSAFSNMHITVPRPKLPVISYTTDSVSFGEGGSVSIPKFSVHWNALGGIFDRATLLPGINGLQGVGEAGPEAVLPLDTLWQHMREIMADTLQGSLFEQMLDRLDRLTGGNGNANQMQLAGAGGETIVFSPTYNLYGTATKDDAVAAGRQTFEEFKRFMAQYERDKRRKRF